MTVTWLEKFKIVSLKWIIQAGVRSKNWQFLRKICLNGTYFWLLEHGENKVVLTPYK